MDVAFIVHLNITDVTTIADESARLQDDLERAGHDVISVAPWPRPTVQSVTLPGTAPVVPLPSPPTEPPTL